MKNVHRFTKLITSAFLAAIAMSASAQEMCFSCKGTYFLRGDKNLRDGYVFGMCLNRNDLSITYDTEGSTQSTWRFHERTESLGTTYYYWRKEYENNRFGKLSEQIELSDVKYHYQYVAKDKRQEVAIAINGHCSPVLRIGK